MRATTSEGAPPQRVIKLTTPWPHDYYSQTPGGAGIVGGYRLEINNDCRACDYWVVWGGLNKTETVDCPPQNVCYITDEGHLERHFNQLFLKQFPTVFTCRRDLVHQNLHRIHDLGIWYFRKSWDEIVSLRRPDKSRDLSAVSSDLTLLEGHKRRYAFVHQLMGHFKERVDVFGRGINPIAEKFDALAPYRYSVAIENSQLPDYFTEKITECYLTYTMPIYCGCPNITEYFDERSLIVIDPTDYVGSIARIERALAERQWEKNLEHIVAARQTYLDRYHALRKIVDIVDSRLTHNAARRKVRVRTEAFYTIITRLTHASPSKIKELLQAFYHHR